MPRRALSSYRAKRDFTKTAKPSGDGSVPPSQREVAPDLTATA